MKKNTLEILIRKALKEIRLEEQAKPDFLDLDGDGDKEESMKKAARDKKKSVKEAEITAGSDNTIFKIKVDVSNKQSETKLGVRIQLTPKEGMLEPDVKDKREATVMKKLNTSLGQYEIQVSKDTDVPNPEVLGFFIPLSQIKNMIVKSLGGQAEKSSPSPEDIKRSAPKADIDSLNKLKSMGDDKDLDKEPLNEMRVRDLNEISRVVVKEDFYNFINAGNNVLRTLEENGIQNGKKYLGYLVKHNIM